MPQIKTWMHQGAAKGPRLLVLGAIHGNEKCGTEAIARLHAELTAGVMTLGAGRLTLAPVCNPAAYAAHARFIDANLNRVIARHETPSAREHHLAHEVMALIDDCDILLDLHSYSAGDKPFLFLDREDETHRAYAAALGITHWVTGWNDAYAEAGDLNGGDTVSYAQSAGKTGVLVECGIHTDPAGAAVGHRAILGALAHFGMVDANLPAVAPDIHRMYAIVAKKRAGTFVRDWQHLDPVRQGDVIGRYDDGETVTAPQDGVVLLPHDGAAVGHEWVYFGRKDQAA